MNDENAGVKHGLDLTLITSAPDYLTDADAPAGWIMIDPSRAQKSDDVVVAFLMHDKPMFREMSAGKFCQKRPSKNHSHCAQIPDSRYLRGSCCPHQQLSPTGCEKSCRIWGSLVLISSRSSPKQVPRMHASSPRSRQWQNQSRRCRTTPTQRCSPYLRSASARLGSPLKTNNIDDILDVATYSSQILMEHQGSFTPSFELSQDRNKIAATTAEEMALPFLAISPAN